MWRAGGILPPLRAHPLQFVLISDHVHDTAFIFSPSDTKTVISDTSKLTILDRWQKREAGISYRPASEMELFDFESIHGPIPEDFRWFLQYCGSGVIGSEWIDGIDDLYSSHTKFHVECQHPQGWKTREMFIIGWDGSGNPIGIMPNGTVVTEDHNFGGLHTLSPTLEAFILAGL
jgi:hypothetical protein